MCVFLVGCWTGVRVYVRVHVRAHVFTGGGDGWADVHVRVHQLTPCSI